MEAAELLTRENISAEVIDVRCLYPLDINTITESVRKTGNVLVLNQACQTCCFGEHIAYEIQNRVFNYLNSPVQVIGAQNVPPPMAQTLERSYLPNTEKVVAMAISVLNNQRRTQTFKITHKT